jgi:hypothetical protein
MAAFFTGRERFARTLAGAVIRSRITILYGQSGAGKSSVLSAAFPQAIRAILHDADEAAPGAPFRLLHFRRWHPGFETRLFHAAAAKLGAQKDSSLAAAVASWGRDRDPKAPGALFQLPHLRALDPGFEMRLFAAEAAKIEDRRDSSLAAAVPSWGGDGGPQTTVILVLDQFEEFLLYHPKPVETRFVQNLATIGEQKKVGPGHVAISMRERLVLVEPRGRGR